MIFLLNTFKRNHVLRVINGMNKMHYEHHILICSQSLIRHWTETIVVILIFQCISGIVSTFVLMLPALATMVSNWAHRDAPQQNKACVVSCKIRRTAPDKELQKIQHRMPHSIFITFTDGPSGFQQPEKRVSVAMKSSPLLSS